eukprot:gene7669-10323_t
MWAGIAAAICCGALVVIVGFTIYLAFEISSPLTKVAEEAEAISEKIGDALFDDEEAAEGGDFKRFPIGQVADLSQTYHHLVKDLHKKRHRKIRKQRDTAPKNPMKDIQALHHALKACDLPRAPGEHPPEPPDISRLRIEDDEEDEYDEPTSPLSGIPAGAVMRTEPIEADECKRITTRSNSV